MARQGRPTKCYVALLSEGPYLLKEIFTPSTMGPRLWCHLIDPHFQISLALWLAKLLLPTGFMLISPTCMVSHSPTGPAWFHGVAAAGPFKATPRACIYKVHDRGSHSQAAGNSL